MGFHFTSNELKIENKTEKQTNKTKSKFDILTKCPLPTVNCWDGKIILLTCVNTQSFIITFTNTVSYI